MLLADYLGAAGLALVEQVSGCDAATLADAGATPAQAASLLHLWQVYFGDTAFTRKQRVARGHAESLTLGGLENIERWVTSVRGEQERWDFRIELAALPSGEVDDVARARLCDLVPPRGPEPGVRITRRPHGPHTLSITDDGLAIADLQAMLRGRNEDLLEAARGLVGPVTSVQAASASVDVEEGSSVPVPLGPGARVATNVIVTLDELVEIAATADDPEGGNDEVVLRMTSGAVMTGSQLVSRVLEDYGLVTLIHPLKGPVNAYRTQRFANEKQRVMLKAESPTCAWVGCNAPADEAQFHHCRDFAQGGNTNVEEMTVACRYHNGINGLPGRGRLARVNGKPAWVPPWADATDEPAGTCAQATAGSSTGPPA